MYDYGVHGGIFVEAYCITCSRLQSADRLDYIFKSGFVRIQGNDHPMGICTCTACPFVQEPTRHDKFSLTTDSK